MAKPIGLNLEQGKEEIGVEIDILKHLEVRCEALGKKIAAVLQKRGKEDQEADGEEHIDQILQIAETVSKLIARLRTVKNAVDENKAASAQRSI